MKKQTGAVLLIAGTCIGGGMIALPMVLSKIGLIPSIALMLLTWAIIYYTAIINLELSLQAGKPMSLADLGEKFSGKIAKLIGNLSFQVLSFALVAVYIHGGSSVLENTIEHAIPNLDITFFSVTSAYSLIAFFILSLPIKFIDYINRLLFIALIIVIGILVAGLALKINWTNLPLFCHNYKTISPWVIIIPVVFTSFGFHASLPTIIAYCNNNMQILKKAFFWGCCIPSLVYLIWTFSTLSVVYDQNPAIYQKMINGTLKVGDFVKELSLIINSKSVQVIVWWISFLAIFTSLIGVGISLKATISQIILKHLPINEITASILSSIITILPSYLMSIIVPNAFISVLGFAGMILAIIAIILPIYLLKSIKDIKPHCSELKENSLVLVTASIGVIIIISELLNILK